MIEILVPRENVNDDSVIIRAIHIKSGEFIKTGQPIVEIETSKTNIEIESPNDGLLTHKLEVGTEISVGAVLFWIGGDNTDAPVNSPADFELEKLDIKISKAALKRSKELNIDPTKLGVDWITAEHIEKKAGLVNEKSIPSTNTKVDLDVTPSLTLPLSRIPLSKRKQSEIKNLQMGGHQSTSSTIGINLSISNQRMVPPPFLFQDGISDLLVFEGSRLLRKYPELNSAYIDSKTWGKYDDINFGWSFDGGSNLKVLCIKNSDQLSLTSLQTEVTRLLDLYESNKSIPIELLTSSTVTLSDLSRTDASFILPLINGYQSLILGVVKQKPNNFSIYATFDHRVSEGLRVSGFLSELKSRILSHYLTRDEVLALNCYACEKTMAEEISMRHRGFIKITLPNGDEANLCRNCFEGW